MIAMIGNFFFGLVEDEGEVVVAEGVEEETVEEGDGEVMGTGRTRAYLKKHKENEKRAEEKRLLSSRSSDSSLFSLTQRGSNWATRGRAYFPLRE
jgi:hypothetical protein